MYIRKLFQTQILPLDQLKLRKYVFLFVNINIGKGV